jgi:hypothetical protein
MTHPRELGNERVWLPCACAGASVEQIQADSEKAAVASEQVLKESNPGELANQWRASDPLQAAPNQ